MHKQIILLTCLACEVWGQRAHTLTKELQVLRSPQIHSAMSLEAVDNDQISQSNRQTLNFIKLLLLASDPAAAFAQGVHRTQRNHGLISCFRACGVQRPGTVNMFFDLFGNKPKTAEKTREQIEAEITATRIINDKQAQDLKLQQPSYQLMDFGDGWEMRKYESLDVIEAGYNNFEAGAALVMGYAQGYNQQNQTLPITSPSLVYPLRKNRRIQFILPKQFGVMSMAPKPSTPAMEFKKVPGATYVVGILSGAMSEDEILKLRDRLVKVAEEKGLTTARGAQGYNLILAEYSNIFGLEYNRKNEVWVPLER